MKTAMKGVVIQHDLKQITTAKPKKTQNKAKPRSKVGYTHTAKWDI